MLPRNTVFANILWLSCCASQCPVEDFGLLAQVLTSNGIRTDGLDDSQVVEAFLQYLVSEVPLKWEFDTQPFEVGDPQTQKHLKTSKPFQTLFR